MRVREKYELIVVTSHYQEKYGTVYIVQTEPVLVFTIVKNWLKLIVSTQRIITHFLGVIHSKKCFCLPQYTKTSVHFQKNGSDIVLTWKIIQIFNNGSKIRLRDF